MLMAEQFLSKSAAAQAATDQASEQHPSEEINIDDEDPLHSKTVTSQPLAKCPNCPKVLLLCGIFGHFGRVHGGLEFDWDKVKLICPFCDAEGKKCATFTTFEETQAHVEEEHEGCTLVHITPGTRGNNSSSITLFGGMTFEHGKELKSPTLSENALKINAYTMPTTNLEVTRSPDYEEQNIDDDPLHSKTMAYHPNRAQFGNKKIVEKTQVEGGEDMLIDDGCYEFENINARRVVKGKVEYRIRWKGCTEEDDTWVAQQQLFEFNDLTLAVLEEAKQFDGNIRINECIDQDKLLKVIDQLKNEIDYEEVFIEPFWEKVVNGLRICPDYRDVIQQPMCLETIEEKAREFQYKTVQDFAYDVNLMVDNCLKYNTPDADQSTTEDERDEAKWFCRYAKKFRRKWKKARESVLRSEKLIFRPLVKCPDCHRVILLSGIFGHVGRVHGGLKFDWGKVTYLCPFCDAEGKECATFEEMQAHVEEKHEGCTIHITPSTRGNSSNTSNIFLGEAFEMPLDTGMVESTSVGLDLMDKLNHDAHDGKLVDLEVVRSPAELMEFSAEKEAAKRRRRAISPNSHGRAIVRSLSSPNTAKLVDEFVGEYNISPWKRSSAEEALFAANTRGSKWHSSPREDDVGDLSNQQLDGNDVQQVQLTEEVPVPELSSDRRSTLDVAQPPTESSAELSSSFKGASTPPSKKASSQSPGRAKHQATSSLEKVYALKTTSELSRGRTKRHALSSLEMLPSPESPLRSKRNMQNEKGVSSVK